MVSAMCPIAHTSDAEGKEHQTLYDHSKNVAGLTGTYAEAVSCYDIGSWLGWWHDLGKAHPAVQQYLLGNGNETQGPDHSSIGMLAAAELPLKLITAGHHGGLQSPGDIEGRQKRKAAAPRIQEALELAQDFATSWDVGTPPSMGTKVSGNDRSGNYELEMLTRMLHSALVDADVTDTAQYYGEQHKTSTASMQELYRRLQRSQAQFGEPTTAINRARSNIYDQAVQAADQDPGLFDLTVPTGGGKTRALMGFALRHAIHNELSHVIVALPYTSIIEQNAQVYRDIFGAENVLEHHSAVNRSDNDWYDTLSADNWDAPIVVTTTVQLLETMFSRRNSRLRKLHRYAESCIVIDEVQSVPPHLTEPTLSGLQNLLTLGRGSVVFCTATQPDYSPVDDVETTPIVAETEALYKEFERVTYHNHVGSAWSEEELAARATGDQALVICNTTGDASAIARRMDVPVLSTRLCPAHRGRVLKDVVEHGLPLVSTQVIEAGVDISYPVVYRAAAPIISIVQAAGRCNRNAETGRGDVHIFRLENGHCPPGAYTTGRDIAIALLEEGRMDLNHPDATGQYYRELFGGVDPNQDGAVDPDQNDVQRARRKLNYPETAARYEIIPDESTDVVTNYNDAHSFAHDLKHLCEERGYMPQWVRRKLQPYTVSLYDDLFDKAVEQSQVKEIAPDLWLLRADLYDSTFGVNQEAIKYE